MKKLAILRIQKLKSLSEIGASANHTLRSRPTPNANADIDNEILIGSNPSTNIIDRLSIVPKKRKNAVLALELVCTSSPNIYNDLNKDERRDLGRTISQDSIAWARKIFGEQNVVSAVLHLDETTPHCVIYVVPVDSSPKSGGKSGKTRGDEIRLNAARWVDGRQKLIELQDDFASSLSHLGLQRGIRGSKAKHLDIKNWYEIVNTTLPDLKTINNLNEVNQIIYTEIENMNQEISNGQHLRQEHLDAASRESFDAARKSIARSVTYNQCFRETAAMVDDRNAKAHHISEEIIRRGTEEDQQLRNIASWVEREFGKSIVHCQETTRRLDEINQNIWRNIDGHRTRNFFENQHIIERIRECSFNVRRQCAATQANLEIFTTQLFEDQKSFEKQFFEIERYSNAIYNINRSFQRINSIPQFSRNYQQQFFQHHKGHRRIFNSIKQKWPIETLRYLVIKECKHLNLVQAMQESTDEFIYLPRDAFKQIQIGQLITVKFTGNCFEIGYFKNFESIQHTNLVLGR